MTHELPDHDDGFTPLQNTVWRTASAVAVAFYFLFGYRVSDLTDPFVVGFWTAISVVTVWLTRKWVRSSITDEKIRRIGRR